MRLPSIKANPEVCCELHASASKSRGLRVAGLTNDWLASSSFPTTTIRDFGLCDGEGSPDAHTWKLPNTSRFIEFEYLPDGSIFAGNIPNGRPRSHDYAWLRPGHPPQRLFRCAAGSLGPLTTTLQPDGTMEFVAPFECNSDTDLINIQSGQPCFIGETVWVRLSPDGGTQAHCFAATIPNYVEYLDLDSGRHYGGTTNNGTYVEFRLDDAGHLHGSRLVNQERLDEEILDPINSVLIDDKLRVVANGGDEGPGLFLMAMDDGPTPGIARAPISIEAPYSVFDGRIPKRGVRHGPYLVWKEYNQVTGESQVSVVDGNARTFRKYPLPESSLPPGLPEHCCGREFASDGTRLYEFVWNSRREEGLIEPWAREWVQFRLPEGASGDAGRDGPPANPDAGSGSLDAGAPLEADGGTADAG